MVGVLPVVGLTLRQLDSTLASRFADYYKNCFVTPNVENRRCIVFASGAGGGGGGGGGAGALFSTPQLSGKVIKLENEKMSLFEVLAQAGNIGLYSKMDRVRIIRGELTKPEVIVVDLTHIYTITKQDLTILPNDIIYIEPGRRPALDIVRDISQVGGFFIGTVGLVYVFIQAAGR
jgi:polysaccharide export outer membrane protein